LNLQDQLDEVRNNFEISKGTILVLQNNLRAANTSNQDLLTENQSKSTKFNTQKQLIENFEHKRLHMNSVNL
jgi:hypothetical protein